MIMSTLQNWVGAGKELVNWCMEKLPSPPSSLTEGRFWFNTTRKRPEFYNGTEVKDFGVSDHEMLTNLMGGSPVEHYHTTAAEKTNYAAAYTHSQTLGNPHGTTISAIPNLSDSLSDKVSKTATADQLVASKVAFFNDIQRTVTEADGSVCAIIQRRIVSSSIATRQIRNIHSFGDKGFIIETKSNLAYGNGNTFSILSGSGAFANNTFASEILALQVTAEGGVIVGSGVANDGEMVLRINSERPWAFYKKGTSGNTITQLRCESDDKLFEFADANGNSIMQIYSSTVGTSNSSSVSVPVPLFLASNSRPATTEDSYKIPDTAWVKDVCPQLSTGFSAGTKMVYTTLASKGTDSNTLYYCY